MSGGQMAGRLCTAFVLLGTGGGALAVNLGIVDGGADPFGQLTAFATFRPSPPFADHVRSSSPAPDRDLAPIMLIGGTSPAIRPGDRVKAETDADVPPIWPFDLPATNGLVPAPRAMARPTGANVPAPRPGQTRQTEPAGPAKPAELAGYAERPESAAGEHSDRPTTTPATTVPGKEASGHSETPSPDSTKPPSSVRSPSSDDVALAPASSPSGVEPVEREPARTAPVQTEPVLPGPVQTEPVRSEPPGSNPVRTGAASTPTEPAPSKTQTAPAPPPRPDPEPPAPAPSPALPSSEQPTLPATLTPKTSVAPTVSAVGGINPPVTPSR
jgi:hypothetical protein